MRSIMAFTCWKAWTGLFCKSPRTFPYQIAPPASSCGHSACPPQRMAVAG